MPNLIDLKDLSLDVSPLWSLLEALRGNQPELVLVQGQIYTHPQTLQQYVFNQTVLGRVRRSVKAAQSNEPGTPRFAYEFFDSTQPPLGQGKFGQVFQIQKTLSLNDSNQAQWSTKSRVVKVYLPYNPQSLFSPEYERDHLVPHLSNKPLVAEKYLVMRRLPGLTLHDLINQNSLNGVQKFAVTRAMLKAFQQELHEPKIAHNDLHPGNMLVHWCQDRPQDEPQVHVIDFNWAMDDPERLSYARDLNLLKYSMLRLWGKYTPYRLVQVLESMKSLEDMQAFVNQSPSERIDELGCVYACFENEHEQKLYEKCIELIGQLNQRKIHEQHFSQTLTNNMKTCLNQWALGDAEQRQQAVHAIIGHISTFQNTIEQQPALTWELQDILKELAWLIVSFIAFYPLVNYCRHQHFFTPTFSNTVQQTQSALSNFYPQPVTASS